MLTGTNEDFDPTGAPAELPAATVRTEFAVSEGIEFARVAILHGERVDGGDVDLFVVDKDTGKVVFRSLAGNNERADLQPGTYAVYVNQYAAPEGAASQPYNLYLAHRRGCPAGSHGGGRPRQPAGDRRRSRTDHRGLAGLHARGVHCLPRSGAVRGRHDDGGADRSDGRRRTVGRGGGDPGALYRNA
ncbi:hypothetical protein ACIQVK_31900 [Streptomyces sp. NPDC090493]|uniref:hypothetical protein n=1 Tax=Streptomyces sp. NPDC090493 TaxID=3365964 RepID=UPI0038274B00